MCYVPDGYQTVKGLSRHNASVRTGLFHVPLDSSSAARNGVIKQRQGRASPLQTQYFILGGQKYSHEDDKQSRTSGLLQPSREARKTAIRNLIRRRSTNHRTGQTKTTEPHLYTRVSGRSIPQAERISGRKLDFTLFFSVGKKTSPKISENTGTFRTDKMSKRR